MDRITIGTGNRRPKAGAATGSGNVNIVRGIVIRKWTADASAPSMPGMPTRRRQSLMFSLKGIDVRPSR